MKQNGYFEGFVGVNGAKTRTHVISLHGTHMMVPCCSRAIYLGILKNSYTTIVTEGPLQACSLNGHAIVLDFLAIKFVLTEIKDPQCSSS